MNSLRILTLLLMLLCTASISANEKQADETLLILGAVPQEIPFLVQNLKDKQKGLLEGIPYWQGTLQGKKVVVAITGVGKTFTAMTATLFLSEFQPRMAVMTGTGARINPDLRTGDVIVPSVLHFHDFGSLSPESMNFRPIKGPVGANLVQNRFEPDAALLELAETAMQSYSPQLVEAGGAQYKNRVRLGVVATSDLFGVPAQRIAQLKKEFNTDIMEMESAAFALVCQSLGVPYLVVRSGSNLAQEVPNNDYLVLGPIAAEQAARFTYHLIKYL